MDKYICDNNISQKVLDLLFEGVYVVDKDRIVQYWNEGAEKIVGYTTEEVVGKRCEKFLMHVSMEGECLCDSSCPFAASLIEGKVDEVEAYIHHKEGHRIPVSIRTIPIMGENRQITGSLQFFRDNSPRESLVKELQDMKDMVTLDDLTGLRNRRYAKIIIKAKLKEISNGGYPFGLLFIDIDRFKNVNDTFGHDIGDLVLQMLAKTLLNNVRHSDEIIRWGGEEIVLLLVGTNIQVKLREIAEKLRVLIAQSFLPLEDGQRLGITVSIGATLARSSDTMSTIIRRGDQLMYAGKNDGGNCVKSDI